MNSRRFGHRLGVFAGGTAIIAMGALTAACGGGGGGGTPSSTTTTTTTTTTSEAPASSAPASPSEKSLNPTGGNLFTPPVTATPAPNVPPGQHSGIGGIN